MPRRNVRLGTERRLNKRVVQKADGRYLIYYEQTIGPSARRLAHQSVGPAARRQAPKA